MALKRAGFYREIFRGEPPLPSLASLIGDSAQPEEAQIIQYLRSGRATAACGGVVPDAFDQNKRIGFCTMLTDGVWKWPSTFIYYVEKYHCRLQSEFVQHMRSRNWRVDPA